MKTFLNFAVIAVLINLTAGCLLFEENTWHPSPQVQQQRPRFDTPRQGKEPWVNVSITSRERQIIRDGMVEERASKHHGKGKKGKSLPPGLAKKVERGGELPPGWQKKLVRGEVMPQEIYRECRPLPNEVIVRLPPQPSGTILVTIEGKVVRLARATLEILDVFDLL